MFIIEPNRTLIFTGLRHTIRNATRTIFPILLKINSVMVLNVGKGFCKNSYNKPWFFIDQLENEYYVYILSGDCVGHHNPGMVLVGGKQRWTLDDKSPEGDQCWKKDNNVYFIRTMRLVLINVLGFTKNSEDQKPPPHLRPPAFLNLAPSACNYSAWHIDAILLSKLKNSEFTSSYFVE